MLGFTPQEALRGATMLGGQLMDMGDELGLLTPATWPTCWWCAATRPAT